MKDNVAVVWQESRPLSYGLEFGDADCYNKTGKTPDVIAKVADKYRANDRPGVWILPNDGYGCGYVELHSTIEELHTRGFYTGLWTEKGLDRIAHEVGVSGSRVMSTASSAASRTLKSAISSGGHSRRH